MKHIKKNLVFQWMSLKVKKSLILKHIFKKRFNQPLRLELFQWFVSCNTNAYKYQENSSTFWIWNLSRVHVANSWILRGDTEVLVWLILFLLLDILKPSPYRNFPFRYEHWNLPNWKTIETYPTETYPIEMKQLDN